MNEDMEMMPVSKDTAEQMQPLGLLTRRGSIKELEARVADLAAEAEDLLALAAGWQKRVEALEAELVAQQETIGTLRRQLHEKEAEIRLLTTDKATQEEAKRSWMDRLRRR